MSLPWTLDEARSFISTVQELIFPLGHYVALTGSVLFEGESKKDLDLIIYPADTTKSLDAAEVRKALVGLGMRLRGDFAFIRMARKRSRDSRRLESLDTKEVEFWTWGEKRVDIFWWPR